MRRIRHEPFYQAEARIGEVTVCNLVWRKPGNAFQVSVLRSEATKSHSTGVDLKQRYGTDGSGYTIGLYHKECVGGRLLTR